MAKKCPYPNCFECPFDDCKKTISGTTEEKLMFNIRQRYEGGAEKKRKEVTK